MLVFLPPQPNLLSLYLYYLLIVFRFLTTISPSFPFFFVFLYIFSFISPTYSSSSFYSHYPISLFKSLPSLFLLRLSSPNIPLSLTLPHFRSFYPFSPSFIPLSPLLPTSLLSTKVLSMVPALPYLSSSVLLLFFFIESGREGWPEAVAFLCWVNRSLRGFVVSLFVLVYLCVCVYYHENILLFCLFS